jgi:FHA domain
MSVRLVALDEGSDISLDREMLVVGRHPQCDARLDSIRVSRRHCCMTPDNGEIVVKDLGSTNGIRINGQRVEKGRLRPGDELSIAHIRYRLDDGIGQEMTVAEPVGERDRDRDRHGSPARGHNGSKEANAGFRLRASTSTPPGGHEMIAPGSMDDENPLAAAVRDLLPAGVADKCRIQVIVQMPQEVAAAEDDPECRPD